MKTPIIAIAASAAFFVLANQAQAEDIHANQVKVPYYGNQQAQNEHFDGRLQDQHATDQHLQREITGFKAEARGRIDGNDDAIQQTKAQATADRKASVQRDQSIESESLQRDTVIASQVDYNEQVSAAYRRQSAAQFEQHGAAIESNTQAITNEREARKQQGREANAGIASAAAIGQHHFDTNYHGFQLSVSGAGYRGEHAQSLSAGGALTDSIFGSIAVSHDSRGNQAWGANTTWKF